MTHATTTADDRTELRTINGLAEDDEIEVRYETTHGNDDTINVRIEDFEYQPEPNPSGDYSGAIVVDDDTGRRYKLQGYVSGALRVKSLNGDSVRTVGYMGEVHVGATSEEEPDTSDQSDDNANEEPTDEKWDLPSESFDEEVECPCCGEVAWAAFYTEEIETGTPTNMNTRGAVAPAYQTKQVRVMEFRCNNCETWDRQEN